MARNKNSTALFDVIHAAKKPPKSSPSASIPAPRWWGKDKKPLKPASAAEPAENVGKQRSWLSAARQNNIVPAVPAPVVNRTETADESSSAMDPTEIESAAQSPGTYQGNTVESRAVETTAADAGAVESQPPAPRQRFIDRFVNRVPKRDAVEESVEQVNQPATETVETPSVPLPLPMPVFYSEAEDPAFKPEKRPSRLRENRDTAFALDPASREIRFSLSYGGLVAIGLILLMALAIAFIAGTHSPSETAMTTDDKATNSTNGMMAAVGNPKVPGKETAVRNDVTAVAPRGNHPATDAHAPMNSASAPTQPLLPITRTREIGMVYVVIQSYDDQELAQKACDFLNKSNVPCTVVQGLSGWALRDWYSVVGLQAFQKHDPALEQYEKAATAVGLKFSSKMYNQFQPQAYTWRADSDANTGD